MKKTLHVARCSALLSALLLGGIHAWAGASIATAADTAAKAVEPQVLVRMGDTVITIDEYTSEFKAAARNKFYHGRAQADELAQFQREVADNMITRILLLREVKRRGMTPDQAEIRKTLDRYEQRYGQSPQWQKNREEILPKLTAKLEEDNMIGQLEKQAKSIPEPTTEEVFAYYKANPDKFTEPERVRISAILLKVDPSSADEVWNKAREDLSNYRKRITDGEDFAALAREHSKDDSARKGGDMGYLHTGVVAPAAQEVLAKMNPGELSEPVRVLEGVTLLKLVDRKPAELHGFEKVQARARQLHKRDKSNAAWSNLIGELKKATPAQIDESRFLPLVEEQSGASAAPK